LFFAALAVIWLFNRSKFKAIDGDLTKLFSVQLLLEKIRHNYLDVKIDRLFLTKSLVCLALTILLFVTQTITKLSPGVVAMLMAMVLFAISKVDVEEMLEEIEWSTLLFFAGLFILVGILEEKGVIEWIATNIFMRVGDNPYVMVLMVLWVSGIVSGFLDNIPFTITMIPIVQLMLEATPIPNNILWWALSLGACLGGNLTMIGASANIVSVGMAKRFNQDISFLEFMRFSAVITLLTLVVASVFLMLYLWVVL
jgi:Na+/H+ antiporter NhaD/arsenite permease-like protein